MESKIKSFDIEKEESLLFRAKSNRSIKDYL